MISPFRGDVLITGFVLAIPVLLLGVRGDFTAQEVVTRVLWCLVAGWAAVAVVRFAGTPPTPAPDVPATDSETAGDTDPEPAATP